MVGLPIAPSGQMIGVWEAVPYILEDCTVPLLASGKQIAMATSREEIVLVSGVIGILMMDLL